jgi:hypothetical protein
MTRRELLLGAGVAPLMGAPDAAVPPIDAAKIRPADFADADLESPYELVHFARVANSVVLDGPDRGFIALSVWRGDRNVHPYNARIMENILSLAWFYTAPQKWNPYRGHPALRTRLELAFDYWCRIQSSDGRFSEYGPEQWNLAATAFAVKFISEALRLLKTGPPISADIHERAVNTCRKALRVVLYDPKLYHDGCEYSNQYSNIFAGGAAFLNLYPDEALAARLRERFEASSKDLQSPAGYFYEKDGPDLGYTLDTHHQNVRMAYHYWRGTPLGEILVEQERRFCEWLSFNALPEPGQHFFVLNRSIESRQKHATFPPLDTPVADRCVIARAFATPPERRAEIIRAAREKLQKEWPHVAPLKVGDRTAYSPYRFLQRSHYDWHPTADQMAEARKLLRPLAEQSFVEQRKDTRLPLVFTYVRRPGYYAAFASAPKRRSTQQRLGLTMVWTPPKGVLLQSQTDGTQTAWGTSTGETEPMEAAGMKAEYLEGGAAVRYPLVGGGQKTLVFAPDRIRVTVDRPGEIIERLPVFDPACVASAAETVVRHQKGTPVPGKTFSVVELRATGKLEYEIRPAG